MVEMKAYIKQTLKWKNQCVGGCTFFIGKKGTK